MDLKKIQPGYVLASKPSLINDVFHRSVILLTEHNSSEGTLGFVLNKKTDYFLGDLLSVFNVEIPVYEGGPVDVQSLFFIHKRPDLIRESRHIIDDLYWCGDFNDIINSVNNGLLTEQDIRFFIGYSGWSDGQLNEEIKNNNWYVQPKPDFDLFNDRPELLWKNQLKNKGPEGLIWMNMPENPALN